MKPGPLTEAASAVISASRGVPSPEYWQPDHNKVHHGRTGNRQGLSLRLPRSANHVSFETLAFLFMKLQVAACGWARVG